MTKQLIIYLSGPMSGYPDYNYPEFNRVAKLLRGKGYKVINPAEVETKEKTWEAYMRADIKLLMDADRVVLLGGWERSRGSCLEVSLARQLGMQIVALKTMLGGI